MPDRSHSLLRGVVAGESLAVPEEGEVEEYQSSDDDDALYPIQVTRDANHMTPEMIHLRRRNIRRYQVIYLPS